MNLQKGLTVGVRCEIQPGAFSNEYLISINIDGETLSGFAAAEDVDEEKKLVRATVIDVIGNTVKLRIHASFFTVAAGTALFSSAWANSNLQEVSA